MTASIRTNVLPSQANAIFEDSSFFRRHPDVLLPTLSDVKAECAMQNSSALSEAMRPPPVMHESLGLVVKFGRMRQVHGVTVEDCWPRMTEEQKGVLWNNLMDMVSKLRTLSRDSPHPLISRIDGSALYDVEVNGNGDKRPWTGPFDSVKALHDWFAMTSKMGFEAIWPGRTLEEIPDGFRHLFPDDSKVVFTHGDLHPTNIMVNPDSPGQIVAIID
ncbi:phosphotransferase enzyme family protein [Verticillium dahliae VdLs.17]|uniref:Phosphotransferase enzyme family protein n=2 Tax=Verticillium dahliae TaxID=27337 RepID=G2XBU2_VERDV|nr:phosphotransferase enzyme family protein [Verticillium dahliae VdLs.17]EGY16460.1 phosphotransferase enzyme family protein [Verticillium dahliae VdLs.17]